MASQKEIVAAKREGFLSGASWRMSVLPNAALFISGFALDAKRYDTAARIHYPMPQITRLRVIPDPAPTEPHNLDMFWYNRDGHIHVLYARNIEQARWDAAGRRWGVSLTALGGTRVPITPARVEIYNSLIANPTETVDADDE